MPPRKKPATPADDTQHEPTRRSSRNKPTAAAPPAAPSKPPSAAAKAISKPKGKAKRTRDEVSDDDATAETTKPAAKKPKSTKAQKADDGSNAQDQPAKMVTVIKRGAVPVDPRSNCVDTHQVYCSGQEVWDAMLNQTDVSANQNKNKFYVLQLLHPTGNASSCSLYTRWGRVGENGQSQTKGPWAPAQAISEFKKQFTSKSGVSWENRVGMTAKKGKYIWLERSFEEDDKDDTGDMPIDKSSDKIPDSALPNEVQALCKVIFSTSFIEAHLSSMNYDARKLPLGKLAKSTILRGFAALKEISEVLQQGAGDTTTLEDLTSTYYSIIPHDFGRVRPAVIRDMVILKRELDLVDALGDMEIATKLIQSNIHTDENGNPLNPLDVHFRMLGLSTMEPVHRTSPEFNVLSSYVQDTHGATHNFSVNVLNAFRVERMAETDAWMKAGHSSRLGDGERLLLWHGSRTTNFAGILKQGLRIAPPEAPVTGYMFGKGVYFADMMSKSAGYCYPHLSGNVGILLLCEVAVKPFYERFHAEYDAGENCKAAGKMATKGLGRTQPKKWKDAGQALGNDALQGCHMPDGPCGNVDTAGLALQYNEYIVYDQSQIRLRYLLMVQM